MESLFALSGGVCPIANAGFALLNKQVSDAVSSLATVSCTEQLQQMQQRGHADFATDTTYSSRGWHANEITVLVSNPRTKKIVARKHLLKHTGSVLDSPVFSLIFVS